MRGVESPSTRHHPDLCEPVTRCRNSDVKVTGHEQWEVPNVSIHDQWNSAVLAVSVHITDSTVH